MRWLALSLVAMAAAACAAVLGIEDRELIGTGADEAGGPEGGGRDGPSADGPDGSSRDGDAARDGDAPLITCDPATCTGGGRSCNQGVCIIECEAGSCTSTTPLACPTGTDCKVNCAAGACDKVRCVGGRSCTIDCSVAMSCKNGASCESERCQIDCTSTNACSGAGGAREVECDASVCLVNCGGMGSCNAGVAAHGTTYCGVKCTGASSCATMDTVVSCGTSPDASILCGAASKTCEKAKPTCFGAYCSIECIANDSCTQNYCCDGGTCVVDSGTQQRSNICP
jgi:hypothetical protein